MSKIGWITDIHLNFLNENQISSISRKINNKNYDLILISGDIGEANNVKLLLNLFKKHIKCKIHFVLGNHDYYRGSISDLRKSIKSNYLPKKSIIVNDTYITGADGWYDGLYNHGVFQITMADFVLINELFEEIKEHVYAKLPIITPDVMLKINKKCEEISKNEATIGRLNLEKSKCKNIIFVTHVPPFANATWHNGKISEPNWIAIMSSKHMGDMLLDYCKSNKDKNVTVLCGHTHSSGIYRALDNLVVYTGKSDYNYKFPFISGEITTGENVRVDVLNERIYY